MPPPPDEETLRPVRGLDEDDDEEDEEDEEEAEKEEEEDRGGEVLGFPCASLGNVGFFSSASARFRSASSFFTRSASLRS